MWRAIGLIARRQALLQIRLKINTRSKNGIFERALGISSRA